VVTLLTAGENVLFFTSFKNLILAKVVFSHLSFSDLQLALPLRFTTSTMNTILKNHSEIEKTVYAQSKTVNMEIVNERKQGTC
jgi:hypothetical protein